MIERLFPAEVVTVTADASMWDGPLYPEETASLGRVGEKRRRDFTAGRVAAREALARLGVGRHPLLIGEDRLPVWPEGIVGSLSHTGGYCGVAVARIGRLLSLGLDVESASPLGEEITPTICTESELAWAAQGGSLPCGWPKVIFSVKESFYKCYYPVARRVLGFHDVMVTQAEEEGSVEIRLGPKAAAAIGGLDRLMGRFAVDAAHIAAGFALPAAQITSARRSPSR